jgi:hypothetical protein
MKIFFAVQLVIDLMQQSKQQRTLRLQWILRKHCIRIKVSTYLKKSDPSKNPPNLTEGGVIVRFTVKKLSHIIQRRHLNAYLLKK